MMPGTPAVTARNTATSALVKSWAWEVAVGELRQRRAEHVGEDAASPSSRKRARTGGRTAPDPSSACGGIGDPV